jgi:hypothetical protein
MRTIQINISNDLERLLASIKSDDMEAFIIEAIRKRLEELENKNLEKILIEGYKASSKEAGEIKAEFEIIDLEKWGNY